MKTFIVSLKNPNGLIWRCIEVADTFNAAKSQATARFSDCVVVFVREAQS